MKKNIGRVFLFLACLLSVCGGARATGLLANVPEASSLTLAYQLEIPLDGNWSAFPVAYSVDNTASIAPGSFSRIAYYLELVTGTSTQWIYVAMGAFTTNATQIGVPNLASGEFFHQGLYPTAAPTNATILSNVGGIITGTGIDTVNLEFWPSNYGTGNDYGVPGADNGTYDFGDGAADGVSSGYGSMQIHNYGAQQTLFAYNSWNGGGVPCLGIGNGPVQPDWTFNNNADTYTVRTLQILVGNGGGPAIVTQPVTALGTGGATLNGGLISTGAAETVVTLYWGSTDGGTDAANWTHTNAFPGAQSPGTLSATLSGLPPRTAYSYRFMASNSVATIWTPAATFQTLTDFGPWSQKAPITASGYNRTETLTNFPMLVVLGPSIQGFSYSQFQSGSNADLVFSDGVQSNELNYEIETWNTNGLSYVWVQVPLLTNNATIWAFWGRSGLSTPAYTTNGAAWDGNYLGAGTWRRPTRRTPRTTSSTERWLDR